MNPSHPNDNDPWSQPRAQQNPPYGEGGSGVEPTWYDPNPQGGGQGQSYPAQPQQPPQQQNYGGYGGASGYGDVGASEGTILLRPDQKPSFAWLVVVKGTRVGRMFQLNERGMRIGRDGRCEIMIEDPAVSSEHAKVYKEDGKFVVHDLASANKTFVNGKHIYHQVLEENDKVMVGNTVLIFKQIKEEDLNV